MGRKEGRRQTPPVPDRQERSEHRRPAGAALGRADLIGILAETDGWVAVDKPAGLVVVPAPTSTTSLWRALESQRGERLWAVHRIDRGTSGVVVFARTAETHRELSIAFEHARVAKTYLAFVRGIPPDGVIDAPLHGARRGRTRLAAPGERNAFDAQTDIRVVERFGDASLVKARPRTGRHHQIRAHLKSVSTPLLVDPIYGGPPIACASDLPNWRLTLHAHRLEIGDDVVESQLPDDLLALRTCLQRS